jgi:hypothetical protein
MMFDEGVKMIAGAAAAAGQPRGENQPGTAGE